MRPDMTVVDPGRPPSKCAFSTVGSLAGMLPFMFALAVYLVARFRRRRAR
jgi:hypothetical protein